MGWRGEEMKNVRDKEPFDGLCSEEAGDFSLERKRG